MLDHDQSARVLELPAFEIYVNSIRMSLKPATMEKKKILIFCFVEIVQFLLYLIRKGVCLS